MLPASWLVPSSYSGLLRGSHAARSTRLLSWSERATIDPLIATTPNMYRGAPPHKLIGNPTARAMCTHRARLAAMSIQQGTTCQVGADEFGDRPSSVLEGGERYDSSGCGAVPHDHRLDRTQLPADRGRTRRTGCAGPG